MNPARALIRALAFAILAASSFPALAEGDPARGEILFRPCRACHMIGEDAVHRVGPYLNGVVGRAIGATPGFDYSDDLAEAGADGDIWTEAALDRFLAGPRDYFPGTRMVFRGIRFEGDRADLIAYMLNTGGAPEATDAAAELATPDPVIAAILEIAGDVPYGEYLSSECTACHRPAGGEDIPSIRGLAPSVFISALVAYRDGSRQHQVMNTVTRRLGDEEIAALAAYFAAAD